MDRQVTERDFRMPEYRDADPKDYEFDGSGKPARKDRWETAVRRIASRLGRGGRSSFEIDDVVKAVEDIADSEDRWDRIDPKDRDTWPDDGRPYEIRLDDGSVLAGATFSGPGRWTWRGAEVGFPVDVYRFDLRSLKP